MTTEVLRNMIYARSSALDQLDVVVLDEVHFLQDTYRGPVWEEVIIHLPPSGAAGLPVGHGQQRRRADRVDHDRPRADHGGRRGPPAGPAARTCTWSATGRTTGCTCCRCWSTAGRTATRCGSTPRRHAAGGPRRGPQADDGSPPAVHAVAARRRRHARAQRGCCRRSTSSSAATSATRRPQSCLAAGLRLTTGDERDRIREIVDARLGGHRAGRPRRARLQPVPRAARGRRRRPPRRAWCRRSRRSSRPASRRG